MRKDSELQKRAMQLIVYYRQHAMPIPDLGNGEQSGEKFHTPVIQFPNLFHRLWNAKFAI
jgi:hypothetical protein